MRTTRLISALATTALATTLLTAPASAATTRTHEPSGKGAASAALHPCRSGLVWHNAGDVFELFRMTCDGKVLQLTHTPPPQGGSESPRWGRDGLVYFDSDRAGQIHLFRMKPTQDAPAQQLTVSEGFEFNAEPTPDGRHVVFEHQSADARADGLFVIPNRPGVGESSFRQLTSNPFAAAGGIDSAPDVSPDGRTVAFMRVKDPTFGSALSAVFTVRLDGTGLRQLTPYALNAINPRWSPDGTWLLFSSHGDSFSPTVSADLFVMRGDGRQLRNLTNEPAGSHSFLPAWSPDGRHIVYTHAAPGLPGAQLMLGSVGGSHATVLYTAPPGADPGAVDWR